MRPVVLIVEDDPSILNAFCRMFTLKSCIAIPARTLAAALDAIASPPLPIDGVVLDLWLADGPGERFIGEARRMGLTARIVVHSGAAHGPSERAGLLAMGADVIAPKPCSFADIWSAVLPDIPYR